MTWCVSDVKRVMDEWAPPAWAETWDRVGLQAGRPDQEVAGVAVCLSVTPEVVADARAAGVNMIVAHHPLIWDPIRALRTDDPQVRLCLDIAAGGMACLAAHTNLDVAPDGVNDALAKALGLEKTRPLFAADGARRVKLVVFVPGSHLAQLRGAVSAAGAGVIGAYTHCSFSAAGVGTFLPGAGAQPFCGEAGKVNEEAEQRFETLVPKPRLGAVLRAMFDAHPYEEVSYDVIPLENADPSVGLGRVGELPEAMDGKVFVEHVGECLSPVSLRTVSCANGIVVRRVAVLGGSGGDQIARMPPDVDAYVTGDVKYHDALAARARNLLVVDAGHQGTEIPVLHTIARRLRAALEGLPVAVIGEADPFGV
jgi:dinuclear metal center YbgI/SA1388 family protein